MSASCVMTDFKQSTRSAVQVRAIPGVATMQRFLVLSLRASGGTPVALSSLPEEPGSTDTAEIPALTAVDGVPASAAGPAGLVAACSMAMERYAPPSSAPSDPNDPSAGQQHPDQQQYPYPDERQLLEELLGYMSYRNGTGSTPVDETSNSEEEEEEEEEAKVSGSADVEVDLNTEAKESGAGASEEEKSGGGVSELALSPSGSQPPLPPAQRPYPWRSGAVQQPPPRRRKRRTYIPEEADPGDGAAAAATPPPPLQLAAYAEVPLPPPPSLPYPATAAAATAADAQLHAHLERVADSLIKRRCTVPIDDPLVALYGSVNRDAVQL
ncbi:hypothetical protein VOLCADRAFT_96836 [Volvox carteri f. nagariensis]|uniref:Uncharacterized protein n=1 Tax=Volvox carteri f. nagariensis TaxID=3068 RepID=D8UB69_VOLCA|nr:uncharacterized protein VOLCADRAFT_96836 [Volvox carteri f. nagariensis]EFJ43058.1 hypothetical protein VOLCADRAFT_96836 [Volvox carteri f. nagariensis]|eukprot:XP_002955857.1 hypothetical protein VOLCADRAFT_96836 [Volvox carteri f. nagariensis]